MTKEKNYKVTKDQFGYYVVTTIQNGRTRSACARPLIENGRKETKAQVVSRLKGLLGI